MIAVCCLGEGVSQFPILGFSRRRAFSRGVPLNRHFTGELQSKRRA
jgi:hypothetical protein